MAQSGTIGELARRRAPKQVRAQERVQRILAAARTELEARAPGQIRTEDIARRAGVPVGSLYQYFDGKDALLAAVAEMVVSEADSATVSQLAGCLEIPWEEAVDRVLDTTFGFYRSSLSYRRLLRSIRHTAEFAQITAASNERMADLIALHPTFARSGVPREDALEICRVVVTATNALQDRALADDEIDFDRWLEQTRLLVKSYLANFVR